MNGKESKRLQETKLMAALDTKTEKLISENDQNRKTEKSSAPLSKMYACKQNK